MNLKTLPRILLFLLPLGISAQNELGLRTSNYSGINGIQLNPSSFGYSPLKWDVNIISGGVFAHNDYLYFENTHLIELLNHNGPVLFRNPNVEAPGPDDPDAIYYSYFDATQPMDNSFNTFVGLPSVSFRVKDWSFGLFINSQTAISANNLDPDLDYYSVDQWPIGEFREMDPFNIAAMSWGEIGVNAAKRVMKNSRGELYLGANLKYLMGYEAMYFINKGQTMVTKTGEDSLMIDGGPIEYGFATGADPNTGQYNFQQNGSGLGVDLGFNYIRRSHDKRPYRWRLGASIVDLGYINFGKNAQAHRLDEEDVYEIYEAALDGGSQAEIATAISNEVYNNPTQTLVAEEFTLMTPLALSVQFDYSISQNFFINGTANRRLVVTDKMVERENFFSLAPRYENRWLEVGMPVVLLEDRKPRVGTWIRVFFITVGSDHVNSLFLRQQQFSGSDVYFAIKLNPLDLGGNGSGIFGGKKRGADRCYF